MANWDFPRGIAGMRVLAELGVSHGLSLGQCLAGSGVRQGDLENPSAVVSAEQELRLIRNLLAYLKDVPALGVIAGMRYHYTTFGMLGFAMVTSPDIHEALSVAMRYFNLTFALSRFETSDTECDTLVSVDASALPVELRRFVTERDMAALATVQRELIPDPSMLKSVELAFPPPKEMAPYRQAFGQLPDFGKARNLAVFDRSRMRQPLPQANELVLKSSEEQCGRILARHGARLGMTHKVREHLARNAGLGMDQIARALFMTARTLRRQLTEEGASFATLRDQVRLALAEEYLVVLKLSVEETAYRLGYASAPPFIAAFRRLTGETPLVFKRRQEAERNRQLPLV
ncbi:AraC family transcriptional regulator [Rugamonas apoptosis]|uniref:AraC family transcriptional regulator n=1 Tax=Rugamonas apoptosis TaxID=2758570 RepID=A0A7W2ILA0_9BURK|nr:AraC family transcriptional regulator [Rugamonas apoptosis]MBA5688262.1 AraC family transcriptional regulator [Rugamonas apoptosis]